MRTFFVRVGTRFVNIGSGHVVWVEDAARGCLVKFSTGDTVSDDRTAEDVMVALEKASAGLLEA